MKFVLLVAAASVCIATDVLSYDFAALANRLGWSDENGVFRVKCDFDERLRIGGAAEIPIRLIFSGARTSCPQSILGEGWWFPLLESNVVEVDERTVRLNGLGGEVVYLNKTGSGGEYCSLDKKWTGSVVDKGKFLLNGPDGWGFHYRNGMIESLLTPDGSLVEWIEREKKIRELSVGGKPLMKLDYAGETGLVKEIVYGGARLEFDHSDVPILASVGNQNFVKEVRKYVSRIRTGDGYDGKFIIETNLDTSESSMQIVEKNAASPTTEELITWNNSTGAITAESGYKYKREFLDGMALPALSRVRILDGATETYLFDERNHFSKVTDFEGRVVEEYYIGTPGLAFMQVKKRIIRDLFGVTTNIKHYDDSGKVMKSTELRDGNVVREIVNVTDQISIMDSLGRRKVVRNADGKTSILHFDSKNVAVMQTIVTDGKIVTAPLSK